MADTLVYLDMPVLKHYWWVTKRFLIGAWVPPAGWPEHSPLLKGTLTSYRTVWLCHTKLTQKYQNYVAQAKATKQVYHLRWSFGPVLDHRARTLPSSTKQYQHKTTFRHPGIEPWLKPGLDALLGFSILHLLKDKETKTNKHVA